MEGQSNWYYGETWIKERSAEVVRAGREAQRDTRLNRVRREGADQRRHRTELDHDLARLLSTIDRLYVSRPAATMRQRFGAWVQRLVGGHP